MVRERIAFDTIGGLLRCHVGVHRGRWRAGVLELRIRPQETKTKNQPPGVAGILTTGGTICERTVESRLLLPRSRWDQDRRVLLICCFKPTGNSSVGQGGIEELENVHDLVPCKYRHYVFVSIPSIYPPNIFLLHFCAGAKNLALFTDLPKFFYSKV